MMKRGFTLIELSVVLVIIGLIVGGILVGQDLIHAAEIRTLISEQEKIVAAIRTFQGKYDCTPGDCPHATQFFGQASDCSGATTLNDASGTCNGNGDGVICSLNEAPCNYNSGEHLYAAHHLHLSTLVALPLSTPVSTTGTHFSGYAIWDPGQNMFGSKYGNGFGWELRSILSSDVATTGNPLFCGTYPTGQNELFFGGATINQPLGVNNWTVPGVVLMSGRDGYNIDIKIDDGMPATGYVQSPSYLLTTTLGSISPCSGTFQATSTYQLNARGAIMFMANF